MCVFNFSCPKNMKCWYKDFETLLLRLLVCQIAFTLGQSKETVCGKVEISRSMRGFQMLENCTVVEGPLIIKLIQNEDTEAFQKLSFPDLVEITDYLVLYRVHHLKTLKNLFPNLAVIRGNDLVHSYSLIVYELPHLNELGLFGLTTILRGGVRFERNPNLCFVDSIDWGIIREGSTPAEHTIMLPDRKPECFDICPAHCPTTLWNDKEQKRCWTVSDCQKVPCSHCPNKLCTDMGICCDEYCIGGCTGPGPDKCFACRDIIYNGICQPRCPLGTFRYKDRRCILEEDCKSEGECSDNPMVLLKRDDDDEGVCQEKCPEGYTNNAQESDSTAAVGASKAIWCTKCDGPCPVVCSAVFIDSIANAQRVKGCTVINNLIISITGGAGNESISKELADSLSSIREVKEFISIKNSYHLMSLEFFKNLRIIRGNRLKSGRYALFVYSNPNLQYLFSNETMSRLNISKGRVLFDYNRKLCLDVIDNFLKRIRFNKSLIHEGDISQTNNGNKAQCNITKLQWVTVTPMRGDKCFLAFKEFDKGDSRNLISYMVYYREVTSRNYTMSITEGRDACNSPWKEIEVTNQTGIIKQMLTNLRPYTMYVVYAETVMLSSSKLGGMTDLATFRTDPIAPTEPHSLKITDAKDHELSISWSPPLQQNGIVTYYEIFWKKQEIRHKTWYSQKDFCANELKEELQALLRGDLNTAKEEQKKVKNESENCCSCESGQPRTEVNKDERQRILAKVFENKLHGVMYKKNTVKLKEQLKIGKACRANRANNRTVVRVRRDTDPAYVTNPKPRVVPGNASSPGNASRPLDEYVPPPESELLNKITVTNGTSWTLTNFDHFTVYTIEVKACQKRDEITNKSFCGPHAFIRTRTEASVGADDIDESTISSDVLANGTRFIHWDSPASPNGMVLLYEVRYTKVGSNEASPDRCVSPQQHRENRGFRLPTLSPGNYSYQIRTYTLAKYGQWTSKHYFIVLQNDEEMRTDLLIGLIMGGALFLIILTIGIVWRIARRKFALDNERIISSINPEYFLPGEAYIADEWEVERDDIELLKELGQGSFGMVYEGVYRCGKNSPIPIAIKTLNDGADIFSRANFLKEATHMKQFSCFHVVKLMGVVSKTQPTYVMMELMANGDLKNFLRKHRPDEDTPNYYPKQKISCRQVIKMAGEIADGMAYLASKKFVHRDLAARNCMVSGDWIVKIGDFGMTRDIYETDYYRKGGKDLLPVRWMSPESLRDGKYDSKSDVWSFGVVLWEMATLAAQPYQGLGNEQVLKYVINGDRMECPEGCPQKLYDLMLLCWEYRPSKRPTFCHIIEMIVADLPPSFKDVSFFFGDENHMEPYTNDDLTDFYSNKVDNFEEYTVDGASTQGSIPGSDIELDQISVTTASRRQEPSDYSIGSECAVLHNSDVARDCSTPVVESRVQFPPVDSKPSVVQDLNSPLNPLSSTDSSKESSDSSYALRNGLINGHTSPFQTSLC